MAWLVRAAARRPQPRPAATAQGQGIPYSFGIVKDHAERMAVAGTDPAYAMAKINPIGSARPLNRPDMHSKGDRIALAERHHFGPRLHARALLSQYEFASGKIAARLRQKDR